MNKVDQMWYLLHICYDFTVVVNPFFRAVQGSICGSRLEPHHAATQPSNNWHT